MVVEAVSQGFRMIFRPAALSAGRYLHRRRITGSLKKGAVEAA